MSHNHQYSASHPDCGHRSHYHKPCSYLWCPLLRTQCPFILVLCGWWEVITPVQSSIQVLLCVFVCGNTEMPQFKESWAHSPVLANIYLYSNHLECCKILGFISASANVILHVGFATSPHTVLVPVSHKCHLISGDAQLFQGLPEECFSLWECGCPWIVLSIFPRLTEM